MLEKLAKFRMLQPQRLKAEARHLAPANDNRINGRQPNAVRRRAQLICRWSVEDGQLACHWENDGPHGLEPTQPGGPDLADGFHKPVVVLSYERKLERVARVARTSLIAANPTSPLMELLHLQIICNKNDR